MLDHVLGFDDVEHKRCAIARAATHSRHFWKPLGCAPTHVGATQSMGHARYRHEPD